MKAADKRHLGFIMTILAICVGSYFLGMYMTLQTYKKFQIETEGVIKAHTAEIRTHLNQTNEALNNFSEEVVSLLEDGFITEVQ